MATVASSAAQAMCPVVPGSVPNFFAPGRPGRPKRPQHPVPGQHGFESTLTERTWWEKIQQARKLMRAPRAEKRSAQVRAFVEHPLRIMKCVFGVVKVRFKGVAKNTKQVFALFAVANLYLAGRHLLPQPEVAPAVRPKARMRARMPENSPEIDRKLEKRITPQPMVVATADFSGVPWRQGDR